MTLGHIRVAEAGLVVHAWSSPAGLVALHLAEVPAAGSAVGGRPVRGVEIGGPDALLEELAAGLRAYLRGGALAWDGPLDLRGVTDFQQAIYGAVREIPRGETRTYAAVARAVGSPQAVRAVGNALHRNPVPLVVPCHRVLRSDGGLGGFAGGVALKRKLLALEAGQIEFPFRGA
jgi:methylated-DNA-[protein]-cysteine S-methyltransferase